MPVVVACPKCKKKFTLPDKLLGKPLQCTQCKAQFRTPAPAQAKQAATQADPQQLARRQQAEAAARQKAGELQKLGVDGPIRKTPDIFDGLSPMQGTADPLNNVVMEDPGFAEVKTKSIMDDALADEDPHAGMFQNPALAPPTKSKPKGKKKKKKGSVEDAAWYQQPWFLILAVFVPLSAVGILFSITELLSPELNNHFLFGVIIFCSFVGLIVKFWGLSIVNEEMGFVHALLAFLIDIYILYPIIAHWHAMKGYFFASLALFFAFIALIVAWSVHLAKMVQLEGL